MGTIRTDTKNMQVMYKAFKEEILQYIRHFSRIKMPKIKRELKALVEDKEKLLNDPTMDNEVKSQEVAFLDERIWQLEYHETLQNDRASRNEDKHKSKTDKILFLLDKKLSQK